MKYNKILVIDDSNLITKIVKKALLVNKINGCKFSENSIITASNGFTAIEEFSKHQNIEFVITDVNMPDINGDEIIEVLEDTHKLKDTKVIFITTENISKNISSVILKKSMGIIYKPFNNITFSNQFNSLLLQKNKSDSLIKNIQKKQKRQKQVILDILIMFFKTKESASVLNKNIDKLLNEYITVDEDIKDSELAFVAYHIATELTDKYDLDLDLKIKSFECAFYRKLNNFEKLTTADVYNFQNNFEKNVQKVKESKEKVDIISSLFNDIELTLVNLTKKTASFPLLDIEMFYPYFTDIVNEFSKYDCMYKDKTTIVFMKNINELINFKNFIATYKSNKSLYRELPIATKAFMRCETSFSSLIFKIDRIIPHYIGWINLYLWKRFFELKIFNNYNGTNLSNRLPNIQNLLLQNKQITMTEYKKYKTEKVIVISKDIDILTLFKKKLDSKLDDYSFHVFPIFKHLEIWMKANKADRIVIDFETSTNVFENGLQSLGYFQKIKSCFEAFFMQRIYLIIDDNKMDEILKYRKRYSNIHIIKKSNLKEDFLIKKLFTS